VLCTTRAESVVPVAVVVSRLAITERMGRVERQETSTANKKNTERIRMIFMFFP
jgi:hypothetical protein